MYITINKQSYCVRSCVFLWWQTFTVHLVFLSRLSGNPSIHTECENSKGAAGTLDIIQSRYYWSTKDIKPDLGVHKGRHISVMQSYLYHSGQRGPPLTLSPPVFPTHHHTFPVIPSPATCTVQETAVGSQWMLGVPPLHNSAFLWTSTCSGGGGDATIQVSPQSARVTLGILMIIMIVTAIHWGIVLDWLHRLNQVLKQTASS